MCTIINIKTRKMDLGRYSTAILSHVQIHANTTSELNVVNSLNTRERLAMAPICYHNTLILSNTMKTVKFDIRNLQFMPQHSHS